MVVPFFCSGGRALSGLAGLFVAVSAQAGGFIEDSSARLEARNVYFNRDFRDGHSSSAQGASKREEWALSLIHI